MAAVRYTSPQQKDTVELQPVTFYLDRPQVVTNASTNPDLVCQLLSCLIFVSCCSSYSACFNLKTVTDVVLCVQDVQRNRILAADAIKEAIAIGDRSDFTAARETLQRAIDRINSSITKNHVMCQGLLKDLQECMNRFRDSSSWQQGL